MQASDRFNINSQLEHLQAKYVGTGHADLNRFEWAVNIQRDSYASYMGHYPMLAYFALAENESIGRNATILCRGILEDFVKYKLHLPFYKLEEYEMQKFIVNSIAVGKKMLLPCGLPPEREDD